MNKSMKLAEIRNQFINYFKQNNHHHAPSSSLVPTNDPTLLFTNAGMVQFKDVFLGEESLPYKRAVTVQRCVRAGGKHNDLENVGFTARHHTFFEMMGNFSFGDYFKREAINFTWDFLTNVLKLPKEKLWITVHNDDAETAKIWLEELKVDKDKFSYCGDEDNFWSMGDVGPCGPCTEVFYDHGPSVAGGPPGTPEADGDRYVEIWNMVFMQYDRNEKGEMKSLPKPCVDTGMGIERIAAVVQNVQSNYDIDLFQALIKSAAQITNTKDLKNNSLKVLADHIRSSGFLIADGVLPSNEGRGYVLRRIIRRALRHGHKLGVEQAFFYKLVATLVAEMGDAYPELLSNQQRIERIIKHEEEQFLRTLEQGMAILQHNLQGLQGKELPGDVVFKLYDTYGFPVDLTLDVAREQNITLDLAGFEKHMAQAKELSKQHETFKAKRHDDLEIAVKSAFEGYEHLQLQSCIKALYKDGQAVKSVTAGEEAIVILENTPFYAEGGGQIGDQGALVSKNAKFTVQDTQSRHGAILHYGVVSNGELKLDDKISAEVNIARRKKIMANHSATHLLHAALRKVLGNEVMQKGSYVGEEYLRFDYSTIKTPTADDLAEVELLVNQQITLDSQTKVEKMNIDAAKQRGAMALFGEKYSEEVRVLDFGEGFSVELCGGTHVGRTSEIGLFVICKDEAVASGIRRIEARTGLSAVRFMQEMAQKLQAAASALGVAPDEMADKITKLKLETKDLQSELNKANMKLATVRAEEMLQSAQNLADIKVVVVPIEITDNNILRAIVDAFKSQVAQGIILLAAAQENKVTLVAGVTRDMSKKISARELINVAAQLVGGKGGGRDDFAQAGGSEPSKINEALKVSLEWIKDRLG